MTNMLADMDWTNIIIGASLPAIVGILTTLLVIMTRIQHQTSKRVDDIIKHTTERVDGLQTHLSTRVDGLQTHVTNQIGTVNTRVDNLQTQVTDQGTALNTRMDNLSTQVTNQIGTVNTRVDDLSTRVTDLCVQTSVTATAVEHISKQQDRNTATLEEIHRALTRPAPRADTPQRQEPPLPPSPEPAPPTDQPATRRLSA